MKVTATSASSPNELGVWKTTQGNWWGAVRLVGWITQDSTNLKTSLYFKWQVGAYNYWPYWKESHTYSVSLGGATKTNSFPIPQPTNEWRDLTGAQVITITHNQNGTYSGTMSISGYKCWEAFNSSITIEFPTLTPPVTPAPEPEPPEEEEPIVPIPPYLKSDNRYIVYADGMVLYHPDDQLRVILNPTLSLQLNQTDSFDFTVPPHNGMYSRLSKLGTTIEVHQGPDTIFRGRILDDQTDFYNNKQIHCEGVLAFLGDTLKAPYSAGAYSTVKDLFKAAIDEHFAMAPEDIPHRRIKYANCDVSTKLEDDEGNTEYSYTSDIVSNCVDISGGFIKLNYLDSGITEISLLSTYDHINSQTIEFSKNLLDLTQAIDSSEVYTSVLALGQANENTGVRVKVNNSNPYVEDAEAIKIFGRIVRVFTYDDITSSSELREIAELLLQAGLMSNVTIDISAVDLHLLNPYIEKIHIGDAVRIISLPHNIDAYFQCSAISIDLQNPENTRYTFGSSAKYLTDKTSKI